MSRIGKRPVVIPKGVEVKVDAGVITFKSGNKQQVVDTKENVLVALEEGSLVFSKKSDTKEDRAFWGTYRALAQNAVTGLTQGFKKDLEINGVGYRAAVNGKILNLQLGFSHDINFPIPEGLEISVEKNVISVKGADKHQVGQVASEIRSFRPPEPYKGKGVKYVAERILRKAGKTSKK
ncbi:MAG: 50S ribosomal protein L6 [Sulfuricurvum sp. PC08-66]|nr:MAG: 50S ribosomal protein L6 [Sulfuricurvum sp. PC08-66]